MTTPRITRVSALSGYRLDVEFSDGLRGEIDLSERLFGPVFEPLRDERQFGQVQVDEFGAIAWPCGADLAPDGVRRQLESQVST